MGLLDGVRRITSTIRHTLGHDDKPRPREVHSDGFDAGKARPTTTWWAGRPLSEARNAHKTNTKEDFEKALHDGSNWLEGDVRKEIHGNRIEMRHDLGQETGDNLTLTEWLAKGKASGRGLKLDVKEGEHMDEIVREVKAAHIPSERLMFNLGDGEMAKWGPQLRKEFPHAILAINPTGGGKKLSDGEVNRMIDLAKQGGKPVAFVVKYDRLTDDAIAKLKPFGNISVWNALGEKGVTKGNVDDLTRSLRQRGVDGVIDLRPSYSTWDKVGVGVDFAKNKAGEVARSAWDNTLGRFF